MAPSEADSGLMLLQGAKSSAPLKCLWVLVSGGSCLRKEGTRNCGMRGALGFSSVCWKGKLGGRAA